MFALSADHEHLRKTRIQSQGNLISLKDGYKKNFCHKIKLKQRIRTETFQDVED